MEKHIFNLIQLEKLYRAKCSKKLFEKSKRRGEEAKE